MDEERCRQIDIDQFDVELLREEVIVQVQLLPDPAQKVVEDKVVVAGSQDDPVEQIWNPVPPVGRFLRNGRTRDLVTVSIWTK